MKGLMGRRTTDTTENESDGRNRQIRWVINSMT